jgi:hypothetical protein
LLNGNEYATVASFSATDEVGMAIDMDASTVAIYKNGALQNTVFSAITSGFTYYPMLLPDSSSTAAVGTFNFGQRPFTYAPPSGFKTLNTFNLPEPTIKQPNKYFDASLYTGTRATQTITNGGFQPDLIWFKPRSLAYSHHVLDTIRGTTRDLNTNGTSAEYGWTGNLNLTPNSSGFSIGADSTEQVLNEIGATYVAWQWNAGNANTTNTSGTITSIVRANPTAGFSIVTWTGNVTSGATIGHGLSAVPSMVIVKNRSAGSTNWCVYHINLGNTKADLLNRADGPFTNTNYWNDTTPTSSVFSLGNSTDTNGSGNSMVAYCFAPIPGYSAFGSYTGNGVNDGPFIYTGFRPRFVMFKRTTSADPWIIHDTARDIYNGYSVQLYPNTSGVEGGPYSPPIIDELSNGFKCRSSASGTNGSGDTFIYMAFAEAPFKYARSR